MSFIQVIPFVAIVVLQVLQFLQVDANKSKPKENVYFNLTEFEVLANRSTALLDEPLQQVLNCSSIFTVSATMRHIKICSAEELDFQDTARSRRRRDTDFIEPFASDANEDDVDDEDSYENIDDNKTRTIRGIIISNDKLRAHLPWKFFELRSMRETPCIGACILEELQVLNDTDTPDRQMIIKRITETVKNITTEAVETIADRCINQYWRQIDKLQPSKGDLEVQKCQAAGKLAVCLSKKTYEFCKGDQYKPITTVIKERPKDAEE